MARQILNENSLTPNDGLGDTPPVYTQKINGNFAELYTLFSDSVIEVKQDNLAETLGGTIDSTKAYFIDGVIDFTGTGLNITVPSTGISIYGLFPDISKIICSDNGFNLFSSSDCGNISLSKLTITTSGTGSQVYNCTDASGNNAVEVIDINYIDCESIGELNGFRQGLETNIARFGGKPELTLSGAWGGGFIIGTSIVRGLTDGAYTLYKAGAGFTMQSRFKTNQNIDLPASASFVDFSAANFPNPSTLQLEGCILTRNGVTNAADTNITPNITASNLSSQWSSNNGIPNTFVGGELEITTETTTTITTSGVFVDLAGTYASSDLQHFDSPANGQLRHLGTTPREFLVQGSLILAGTANDEVDLKVVVYRDSTASFEDYKTVRRVINNLQSGRDVAYFSLYSNIILGQNDYVKLMVANISPPNDVTAEIGSSFIVGAR